MPDAVSPERRPAVNLTVDHEGLSLALTCNRIGYARLAELLGRAAAADAATFAPGSPAATQLGDELRALVTPASDVTFGNCALDDSLAHGPPAPWADPRSTFKDRAGLLGCGLMLCAVGMIFLRGVVALWHDFAL